LHLGAKVGLLAGRDLVFTYGPLGFLTVPVLWWTPTAVMAFVWSVALWAALAATVFVLMRRVVSWPLAALGTWVLMALVPLSPPEVAVLLVFLWCLACTAGAFAPSRHRLLVSAAAVLAGMGVLVKVNGGIASLGLVLIAAWVVPPGGPRSFFRVAGLAAVGLIVGWFATGGSLLGLGPFLLHSLEIVSGYTEAMAVSTAPSVGYLLAAVLAIAYGFLLWIQGRPDRRFYLLALSAVAVVVFWKQSFVRYDIHHAPGFFILLALAPVALGRPVNHVAAWLSRSIVVLGALSILVTGAGPPGTPNWGRVFRSPTDAVTEASDGIRTLSSASRRSATVRDARRSILGRNGLEDLPVSELAGYSVHVDAYEVAAVWALGLRWGPVPVFQSYFAYTPALDDLNARALSSARAPDRILRLKQTAIEGRYNVWESPAYMLALVCNYQKVASSPSWEVLAHRPNRCGRARKLTETDAPPGAELQVPVSREGELIFTRINLRRSPVQQGIDKLLRPLSIPEVVLDGFEVHRLIPATSEQPLLLRVPASWGFSPDFEKPLERNSLALRHTGANARVEFWSVPLHGAG
jgi:hypothetical protein